MAEDCKRITSKMADDCTLKEQLDMDTMFVCDACSTVYNTESEATACLLQHKQRIIVKMAYESNLNDDDLSPNLHEEKEEILKKRKLDDAGEESDNEDSRKAAAHSKEYRKVYLWSPPVTTKLIELVKTNRKELGDKLIKRKIWNDIWKELHAMDKTLTLVQVAKKWRNMVQSHKRFYEVMKSGANTRMKRPDFFEDVAEILQAGKGSCCFDISDLESVSFQKPRPSKKTLKNDRTKSSPIVNRFIEDSDLPTDEPPEEDSDIKRVIIKKNHKRIRPPTRSEAVENSILQLVETNKNALQVDRERLKCFEDQVNHQEKFDIEFIQVYKERNEAIQKNTRVVEEFRDLLKEHLKFIKEVDKRTKKIEKLLEDKFSEAK